MGKVKMEELSLCEFDKDNKASINAACAIGFKWIKDDYYGIENPYVKNKKDKLNYLFLLFYQQF